MTVRNNGICEMQGCENPQGSTWMGVHIQLCQHVCDSCNDEQNYWHDRIGT